MSWRVAKSLDVLLHQLNEKFPSRSKDSDGSIGDERHQAESSSDHNPWVHDGGEGVVTARDFTNDPANGLSSEALAQALLAAKDERVKYIISNRRIYSGTDQGHPPWQGRPYSGSNPHDHHVHVSVKSDKAHYDDGASWNLSALTNAPAPVVDAKPTIALPPTLRRGSTGEDVKSLQRLLKFAPKEIDGDFGPKTEAAVKKYQLDHSLLGDGVVGPQTWKSLKGLPS